MTRTTARLGLALATFAALGLGTPDEATGQKVVERFADASPAAAHAPLAAELRTESPLAAEADGFETTGFAQFMASPAGRVLRGVAGAAMIGGGIAIGDTGGTALAIAGAAPLSAGILDLCYVSALFGGPIRGEEIRAAGR